MLNTGTQQSSKAETQWATSMCWLEPGAIAHNARWHVFGALSGNTWDIKLDVVSEAGSSHRKGAV